MDIHGVSLLPKPEFFPLHRCASLHFSYKSELSGKESLKFRTRIDIGVHMVQNNKTNIVPEKLWDLPQSYLTPNLAFALYQGPPAPF